MADIEFKEWPKTHRLFRDIVITEKIDGTNAAINIGEHGVFAQSRKRVITPEADNFGFARWVHDNADSLAETLGFGLHFGEWWGRGIQRTYGMEEGRRFSLFNTAKWGTMVPTRLDDARIESVPVLYEGVFDQSVIEEQLRGLKENGSVAAPGFMDPEGICIYHTQARSIFKVTLDNNDKGKWEANG